MLRLQQYLDCFDDIKQGNLYLRTKLGINAEYQTIKDPGDGQSTTVYLYNGSKEPYIENPIVREAHGLILHTDGDLISKMYDHPTEVESISSFNSNNYRFFEVPDGECISVYNLEGNWHAATATSVNGSEYMKINAPGFTFGQEFWNVVSKDKLRTVSPELIYVFIFTSKYNKKIFPYNDQKAHLVTVINRETGRELLPIAVRRMVRDKGFTPLTETNSCSALSPGLFVMDEYGDRFFYRNKVYTAVKNAIGAGERVSPTHMAKIIFHSRDSRDVDVVSLNYRRYEFMLDTMLAERDKLRVELYELWNSLSDNTRMNNKEFAKAVSKHPFSYLLFMFKDGKIFSIYDAIKKLKPEKLVSLVREREPSKFNAYSKIIKREVGN